MATYYIRTTHEPCFEGPFSIAQIRELLAEGRLEPTAMALEARGQSYWRLQAYRDWVSAGTLVSTAPPDYLPADEPSPHPPSLPGTATRGAIARYAKAIKPRRP